MNDLAGTVSILGAAGLDAASNLLRAWTGDLDHGVRLVVVGDRSTTTVRDGRTKVEADLIAIADDCRRGIRIVYTASDTDGAWTIADVDVHAPVVTPLAQADDASELVLDPDFDAPFAAALSEIIERLDDGAVIAACQPSLLEVVGATASELDGIELRTHTGTTVGGPAGWTVEASLHVETDSRGWTSRTVSVSGVCTMGLTRLTGIVVAAA